MPMTLDQLQKLVKAQKLNYFMHPDRPALMLGLKGMNGSYQLVIALQQEGTFLQFKTMQYLYCREDDANLTEVLKVMGHLNYRIRLVKWGWDPTDGEIDACADTWIEDGTLTQGQFGRIVSNYLTGIDLHYARLKETIETGKDPGDLDPMEMAKRAASQSGLPPELQALLDKLGEESEDEEEDQGFATI